MKFEWKNKNEGELVIRQEDQKMGYVDLIKTDSGQLVLKHTETAAAAAGKGLGRKLVFAVRDYAAEEGLKLNVLCPFARRVLMQSEDQ